MPSFPRLTCPPYLGNLVSFKKCTKTSLCYPNILGGVAFHWSMVHLPRTILLEENCISFSQKLSVSNSSMSSGELCAHLPFCARIWSVLGLHQSYLCSHSHVRSCVQQPCCVWKTLFPSSYSVPLAPKLFPFLLPLWSLNLGKEK